MKRLLRYYFLIFFVLLHLGRVKAQIISTIAGTGAQGYSGDGNSAKSATFDDPYFVTFDHSGNMYIADLYNNVIRKIDHSGVITTIAGTGYGAGTNASVCGYTGDGGLATNA